MKELLAIARRIAIVGAIVVFCGGTACDVHPEGEIAYAPGYGYVVQVVKYEPKTKKAYYVFPTEARARDFYGQYHSNWGPWPNVLLPGETMYTWTTDYQQYEEIDAVKIPLSRYMPPPPPVNEETEPLAVPDLPEPIPPTPQ